MFLRAEYASF